MVDYNDTRRIDKWLWFARFFKSRTLATKFCQSGHLQLNGVIGKKAHQMVRVGDVLTFLTADDVRVIKISDLGQRRGPAAEAQALYQDVSPPQALSKIEKPDVKTARMARRAPGAGRPTKSQRRALDYLRRD